MDSESRSKWMLEIMDKIDDIVKERWKASQDEDEIEEVQLDDELRQVEEDIQQSTDKGDSDLNLKENVGFKEECRQWRVRQIHRDEDQIEEQLMEDKIELKDVDSCSQISVLCKASPIGNDKDERKYKRLPSYIRIVKRSMRWETNQKEIEMRGQRLRGIKREQNMYSKFRWKWSAWFVIKRRRRKKRWWRKTEREKKLRDEWTDLKKRWRERRRNKLQPWRFSYCDRGEIYDQGNSKIRQRRVIRVLRKRRNQVKKKERTMKVDNLRVLGKIWRRRWAEKMRWKRRRWRWKLRTGEGETPATAMAMQPWNRREQWKGMEQSNEKKKRGRRCYGQRRWRGAALQGRGCRRRWRKEMKESMRQIRSVPNGPGLELENKAQVKIMHLGQFKRQSVGPNSSLNRLTKLLTKDFEWALGDVADQDKDQPPMLTGFSQNLVHGPGFSQNKVKPTAATHFAYKKNTDVFFTGLAMTTSVFNWLILIFAFAWQCIGRGWSCSSVIT